MHNEYPPNFKSVLINEYKLLDASMKNYLKHRSILHEWIEIFIVVIVIVVVVVALNIYLLKYSL